MTDRRQELLIQTMKDTSDPTEAKMLDTVMKLILADMGQQYCKFWDVEGPGVMCMQPGQERAVVWMTLEELSSAADKCDNQNNGDLAETFRRILNAAQKIKPDEKAGYIINDENGLRYLEIDYNKTSDGSS
jgi:hypothetical protein|tara:strand:+ start:2268 stop:2660 length:393 start_codon:yes stop_codon:yes gene_type:complete